jgi:type II secretory pathway pseudopilin PulG
MQTRQHMRARQQRGQWTLVGLLVSLAIIAILSSWYYAKVLKPQLGSHNGKPAAEQKAYASVCSEYQSQMTQAVAMYKDEHNDRNPPSFEALRKYGVTDDILKAEGCQFQLDASTGTVTEIGHGQAAPNAQPVVVNSSDAAPAASSAPGPYWQQSAPQQSPASAPGGQAAPVRGPGGITLPPSSSTLPADGGGGE